MPSTGVQLDGRQTSRKQGAMNKGSVLRPTEAADSIGVSPSKPHELITSSQIPNVRRLEQALTETQGTVEALAGAWLTVSEAARVARIGPRSMYRAIEDCELKAARVNGRDLRIHRDWIAEWLERSATQYRPRRRKGGQKVTRHADMVIEHLASDLSDLWGRYYELAGRYQGHQESLREATTMLRAAEQKCRRLREELRRYTAATVRGRSRAA
jgi:excisionase family DNA binding protein